MSERRVPDSSSTDQLAGSWMVGTSRPAKAARPVGADLGRRGPSSTSSSGTERPWQAYGAAAGSGAPAPSPSAMTVDPQPTAIRELSTATAAERTGPRRARRRACGQSDRSRGRPAVTVREAIPLVLPARAVFTITSLAMSGPFSDAANLGTVPHGESGMATTSIGSLSTASCVRFRSDYGCTSSCCLPRAGRMSQRSPAPPLVRGRDTPIPSG